MMADEIKLNYPLMEEMTATFRQAGEKLEELLQDMQGVASTLEDGALVGRGGSAFTEAIRDKLCPAITRLAEKMQEMDQDVQFAMKQFRDKEDPGTAKLFG
jgi:WXG100 family type VII secretion target